MRDRDRPSHMLTIRQAAKAIGMSRTALKQMIALGQMPVWRSAAGRVYIDPVSALGALNRSRGWFSGEG